MNLDRVSAWSPYWLSIMRIMVALLFLEAGTQKLFDFPAAAEPMPMNALLWVQGTIEVVGGILLAVGLFTRPTAFILSGNMAIAYFMVHAPQSFFPINNQGDTAILFSFVFLYFFFAGGGAWSVDAARSDTVSETA
jgi:putative oxidoreductase